MKRDHCKRSHEADVGKARALVESDERLRAELCREGAAVEIVSD